MAGAPSYIDRSPVVDYRQNKALVRRPIISAHDPVPSRIIKPFNINSGSEGFSRISLLRHIVLFGIGAATMEGLYQSRVEPHVQETMAAKDSLSQVAHEYVIPMGIGGGAGLLASLLISAGIRVGRLIRGSEDRPQSLILPQEEPIVSAPSIIRNPSRPSIMAELTGESMGETWAKDLPEYRVLKVLGKGGQGEAILAEKVGEQVVVKRLLASAMGDESAQQRFIQEAFTLKKIVHPNVVGFIEFKVTQEAYYLFMEFIDGKNLYEQLKEGKQFTPTEVISIAYRASEGLKYVWETTGIVHRDIKLDNIMTMSIEPFVKVIDFGIAKSQASSNLTQVGVACSPRYVAPERLKAMSDPSVLVDFRADIYSLGMAIYYLLAGRETYTGVEHALQPLPDIREYNPQVPEKVWVLIQRMTAKDPAQRHASYQQLLDEYTYCLQ